MSEQEQFAKKLIKNLKLKLEPNAKADLMAGIEYVRGMVGCEIDVRDVHSILTASTAVFASGQFRTTPVLASDGCLRNYPNPAIVPALMERFQVRYREVLSGELVAEFTPVHVAWQFGAFGRCVHPFATHNTIVFLLVENHIRLTFGLDLQPNLVTKDFFQQFRVERFQPILKEVRKKSLR